MKKTLTLINIIALLSINYSLGWSYPIKDIMNTNCKTNNIACTYPLPHIQDANYLQYKNDKLYRTTYSMLRSSTYYDGWDMGIGGHQGVDIATAEGTPVLAIADGEIIDLGEKGRRGKTITIKHIRNGKTIYSSYAHLSEILVKIGTTIKQGGLIGKVGATGNTTGPHLHFQIEINDDNNHPFFYKNCIGEINEIVNEARCQQQMTENTIDPILFIEKNGNIPIKKDENSSGNTKNIDYQNIVFSGFLGGILDKNIISKISLTPKNNTNNLIVLDNPINVIYDKAIIKIFPDTFQVIKNKQLLIIPQKTGFTNITFKYNNKIFKKIPIIITDKVFLEKIKDILNKNPNLLKSLTQ